MLTKQTVKEYAVITIGVAIIAAATHFFMTPSHLVVGSATALALVISNFISLPTSIILFCLNICLLVIGFLLIGREFGAKTIYTSVALPAIIRLYELTFPNFQSLTQSPILDTVCYILVVGIGLAIVFCCNASSGGLDIVAKLMNKYMHIELGKAMSLSGMLVALSSALCYDATTVVLSVVGTYFGGMLIDHFIFDINLKRRVCILSNHHDKMVQFILHQLHSGATIYESIGAYDNKPRKEIITIVDKQEYTMLMDHIKKNDPDAFVTVYSVSEVNYRPKKR